MEHKYINLEDAKLAIVDAVQSDDYGFKWGEVAKFTASEIMRILSGISAEDVQPVKQGNWENIDGNEKYRCSQCHRIMWFSSKLSIYPKDYNFCPNCGADMTPPSSGEK